MGLCINSIIIFLGSLMFVKDLHDIFNYLSTIIIMDNCTINYIEIFDSYSKDETCKYVTQFCQQDSFQFIRIYYCTLHQSILLLILISIVILILIYYALNILTNHYLTYSVQQFIHKLSTTVFMEDMSQALAGVTFLAFANGAPDIMTTIVAGSSSSQSTALIPLGSLYGAAIFNMAFILSMVIKFSPAKELIICKKQALIPLAFYILGTIYLFFVSMLYQKMNLLLSIIFFSFYIVFIAIIFYQEHFKIQEQIKQKRKQLDESAQSTIQDQKSTTQASKSQQIELNNLTAQKQKPITQEKRSKFSHFQELIQVLYKFIFDYTVPPTNKDKWSPSKSIISLFLCLGIICITFGVQNSFELNLFGIPYVGWFSIPSFLLLIHSLYCIVAKQKPNKMIIAYSIYSFIITICYITTMCSILISLVELIQFITNINSVFLGLTVFSWANSIGDYLSIVAFAKKGFTSTAVAGIFSGPLMSFLLGFGITCILNSLQGQYEFIIFDFKGTNQDKISDAIVMSVISLTTIYMIWIFIQILQKKGIFKHFEQKFTLIYYIGLLLIGLILTITANFYKQK